VKRFRQAALILLLTAAAFLHAVDKKKGQVYYLKPDQTLDLASPKMVIARESCENWALAAGLETMLQKQDVALDQRFWVMHLNYGELCDDRLPDMSHVADVVNQEFVLDDARHVRLELHFIPGAPTDIDSVLAALQRQQPTLFLWRNHFYYLTGVTYDERVGRDGTRNFIVKELRLADTFAGQPNVTFQKDRDNLSDIGGIVSVSVTAK
jgi:hypothetical protein